ncbi:hypothetical protein GH714_028999 [Hevea brasiliensis]|uniref:GRF-type domain-containing protein n=1 Tax=Hevea brasiliensis TaxID=3981 RepID=A0A6A6LQ70_HEVBR|nr:hypothetical protein GH714_028999 [Hevea brasiliensis]
MAECDLTSPFPSTPPPPSSPPLPALRPFSGPITLRETQEMTALAAEGKAIGPKNAPTKSKRNHSPPVLDQPPWVLLVCHLFDVLVVEARVLSSHPERRKILRGSSILALVKCNFFKWCDELANRAPMCPCGVGICSLNLSRGSTGPNGEEWYFACRIKKNHGACNFFQWVDSEVNTMMKRYVGAAINDLDNKEVSSNIVSESPVVEGDENTPNQPIFVISSEQDEVPNRDLIMQEVESEVLGFHGYGWLGRLAFRPSRCMKGLPVLPIFCCIFLSFDSVTISEDVNTSEIEGSFLLPDNASNTATDMPLSPTAVRDAQLLGGALQEASGLNEPSGITQDESKSILKEYGLALLNTIESMSPVRHGAMAKLAEATLKTLQDLSIEFGPIGEGVKTYIHSISRVASIERSIYKGLTPQELLKLLNSEQVQFENVSRRHAEAVAAYCASNNHFQSLRIEVSSVKDMLLHLEKRLFSCEAETLALKTRVDEISKDMLESKRSMEAASEKMEEALELERQRDTVIGEAKAALETARIYAYHNLPLPLHALRL